jgi:hypothetical protein
MPFIRCATAEEATAAIATVQAKASDALFLFFGSEDPGTGQSWCPDCVTADPVLRRACRELRPDLTVYECPVGLRGDWKGRPEHPLRIHPFFRLQRIPTLVQVERGCERGRLVEADCAKPEMLKAFLGK